MEGTTRGPQMEGALRGPRWEGPQGAPKWKEPYKGLYMEGTTMDPHREWKVKLMKFNFIAKNYKAEISLKYKIRNKIRNLTFPQLRSSECTVS